ncbi:DUF4442 domain-containing protein [Pseudomonas turukhanskensis]|uniref:DUF4442 domain-containing protein n=1 Tax=Pseudomonas turukhanskensis TaxID=1806536 RepID=A0A9W6NGB7_9PSED|nr:DUF4442 domain-containing protein [Pseudomonas turukhanskensis]GLK89665.1 hypothetical protein GCM10017655_27270 [Pseudomonas turukhanskensis]
MPTNRLNRAVTLISKLPHALRTPALSLLFGSQVKFASTAKVRVHSLTFDRAVLSLANRRPVQNHINGVHAAAMVLLAESATGFLVGMNVPDDKLPLIKSLKVDYLKRATGALQATAVLTAQQIEAIGTHEKGEVVVSVTVTDEAGIEPIRCEMLWAWVSKKR